MRKRQVTRRTQGNLRLFETNEILTKDVVRFLRNFSTALKNGRVGNPGMSSALSDLARALQPYSERPLRDILESLSALGGSGNQSTRPTSSRLSDLHLPTLSLEMVEELLADDSLTKGDLLILATERFGIPISALNRWSKSEVIESVQTSVRNEQSLKIISEEATRQGLRRST